MFMYSTAVQVDPLSPLLFGLFIDRVERWLQDRAGDCGVPYV